MMPKFANSATGAEKQMLKRYRNVNDGVVSYVVTEGAGTRWPIAGLGCKSSACPIKKGLYYWGATKPDVIEEKNGFVMEYCRAELCSSLSGRVLPWRLLVEVLWTWGMSRRALGARANGSIAMGESGEWGGVPGSRIWRLALARWPLN
jgi:hypothetical protein